VKIEEAFFLQEGMVFAVKQTLYTTKEEAEAKLDGKFKIV